MSENRNEPDPSTDPPPPSEDYAELVEREPADPGAEGEIDADAAPAEPTQPIDDELSTAVRAARVGPYMPGGPFKPPNTMKILVLVLALVAAFFIYFIVFAGTSLERTDKIRQRTLEQKLFNYEKQERFYRANGYMPAGKTHPPLTEDERALLAGLREKYGRIVITDPDAAKAAPATATSPVPGGG